MEILVKLVLVMAAAGLVAAGLAYRGRANARAQIRHAALVDELLAHPGGMHEAELARAVGREPGTLWADLAVLENGRRVSWWDVECERCGAPGRKYALHPNEPGRNGVAELMRERW